MLNNILLPLQVLTGHTIQNKQDITFFSKDLSHLNDDHNLRLLLQVYTKSPFSANEFEKELMNIFVHKTKNPDNVHDDSKRETCIMKDYPIIDTWDKLCWLVQIDTPHKQVKCDLLHKLRMLNIEHIEQTIKEDFLKNDSKSFDKYFRNAFRELPVHTAYRIWENMFMKPELNRHELLLDDLPKNEKTRIEKEKQSKQRYLTAMTDFIITNCRQDLLINDTFIYKCFEHDLQKILHMLDEYSRFYNISLEKGTLRDVYFVYACDFNNVSILMKMLPVMNINHLEYSLRFGSSGWLSVIYRYRSKIENFDSNMRLLDHMFQIKNFNMTKFFDKWRRNLKVSN